MKQKSIFALVLGAILVLTVSSMDTAFADYNRNDDDRYDSYEKGNDRSDDRNESGDRYDDKDDGDKSERERRS